MRDLHPCERPALDRIPVCPFSRRAVTVRELKGIPPALDVHIGDFAVPRPGNGGRPADNRGRLAFRPFSSPAAWVSCGA